MISDILLKYEPDEELLESFDNAGRHILGGALLRGGSSLSDLHEARKKAHLNTEEVINSKRDDDEEDDKCEGKIDQTANTILSSDTPGGRLMKVMDGVAKGFLDGSAKGFSNAIKAATGDLPDKSWEEIAPEVRETLKSRSNFVSNVLNDPPSREALKELLEEYAKGLAEVHDISKPAMDEILVLFWQTLSEMGEKSAVGAVNTGLNVAKAAVAEIPVVGGLVDLTLALASAFNYFAATVSPMISKGAKMGYIVSKDGEKTMSAVNNTRDKVQHIMKKVRKAFAGAQERARVLKERAASANNGIDRTKIPTSASSEIKAKTTPPLTVAQEIKKKQGGGKKKKRRAKKTIKRLKNTLAKFTRRKKRKPKAKSRRGKRHN